MSKNSSTVSRISGGGRITRNEWVWESEGADPMVQDSSGRVWNERTGKEIKPKRRR